ncbi:MAG: acetyl-coenzyme A synthetase, partial [Gammaproteobacteria bacterium]|nr:acetyl-coenzyme A synthetase [Gammaproteobacteria bacterium]
MSDVDIKSVLIENRLFEPSAEFTAKARLKPDDLKALHQQAEDDYEGFWADQARQYMDWHTPFTKTLDDSQ